MITEEVIEKSNFDVKGYQLHSEETLLCSSCKQNLVSFLIVKLDCPVFSDVDGDIESVKFTANCPKCKSKSFAKIFKNVKLYIKGIDPYIINDTFLIGEGKERKCEIDLK